MLYFFGLPSPDDLESSLGSLGLFYISSDLGTFLTILERPTYIALGVLVIPLVVYVTKSIVPLTGLQTKPKIPLPKPTAPPLIPPFFAPLTGSVITPATAEKTFVSIDLVPKARPVATFDGTLFLPLFPCFYLKTKSGVASNPSPI